MTGVTESSGCVEVSDKEDEEEVGDEAELDVTDLYCGTERMTFLGVSPLASCCRTVRSRGEPTVSLLVSVLMICFTGLAPFLLLAPVGLLVMDWAAAPSIVLFLKCERSEVFPGRLS